MDSQRGRAERRAALLFVGAELVLAIVCGAIIISGWFAGVLEDHAERFFWAGALLGFLAVVVLAAAVFPGGEDDVRVVRRVTALTRVGLILFGVAPALCIFAMVADFYRLLV